MRNLKKVLSMVLVVAMIASMLIVGAAATEEETSYPVAADVISGIKVMEGDERGMRYGDTVTRAEAAAIICRVLLGDTAETLKTSSAPFADVAASHWAAGYIAYLKGQGIISGVSDTEFDPNGKVNGLAFAKMLLVAIGYGVNGEFEGPGWDINVITYANDNGIFAGTKAAGVETPAVREECMLYAFNALLVPTVKYNSTFESYYTGTSALKPVTGAFGYDEPEDNEDPYYYTLAWSKFALCLDDFDTDAFGRPTVTWTSAGTVVADNVGNRVPTKTFTGGITSADIYAAIGKSAATAINEDIANGVEDIVIYEDGKIIEHTWASIEADHITNRIGGAGATVEIYLTNGGGDYSMDIVICYEHIGQIVKVASDKKSLSMKQDVTGTAITVQSKNVDISGFAKGDYVIYTIGSDGNHSASNFVASMAEAEYTTASFSGTNFMQQPVFGGVGYSLSAKKVGINHYGPDGFSTVWDVNTGVEYNLYTDSMGNLIYASENELIGSQGAYEYAYVRGVKAKFVDPMNPDPFAAANNAVAINVAYANGGVATLYYDVKLDADGYGYINYNKSKYYITADDTLKINKAGNDAKDDLLGWNSLTTNSDGEVTLKSPNANYATINADEVTVARATAKVSGIDGYIANSATVLTIVGANGAVKQYTGINSFPKADVEANADFALYTYAYKSKTLERITVYQDESIGGTKQIGYCVFQNDGDQTNEVYNYLFYIDGVATIVTLDDPNLQGSTPYYVTNDNGEWSYEAIPVFGTEDDVVFGGDVPYVDYNATAGAVNAGSDALFGMDEGFGKYVKFHYNTLNATTGAAMAYEWATIDTVDDNFFTTVATEDEDCVAGKAVDSYTYYYDANTKIFDCTMTGNGVALNELTEGALFIAYVNTDSETAYAGSEYCEYIWIVG